MLDLRSEKLLLSSAEGSLLSIYSGTFTAVNGTTQQTDIVVVNPPTIGDAVGMSVAGGYFLPIKQITSSYVVVQGPYGDGQYNFFKNITIGGKPFKWFHVTGWLPGSVFTSPGAVAGDMAIDNSVGAYTEGYPKITAITNNAITVSYYATNQKATVQFKENVPNFVYRA